VDVLVMVINVQLQTHALALGKQSDNCGGILNTHSDWESTEDRISNLD
jgi:hypothetical protein